MSVCVEKELSTKQIELLANTISPTGVRSKWTISNDKTFKDGISSNPCACDQHRKTRLHYLLIC